MAKPWIYRLAGAFFFLVAALLGMVAYSGLKVSADDDLQIWIGQKKSSVDSRNNQGRTYFELKDIVEILRLGFREDDNEATVSGPRGQLRLTGNRPLVRFKDEYILLNQIIWRRKEKEWYVSEDFLQKALPVILGQRLERQAARSYRVIPFEQNRVQVEVTNFPDHVRLTFTQTQNAPISIQEFQDSIRVGFSDFLVVPALPAVKPDSRIVKGVRFDTTEVYGGFRIDKGQDYYNFREYPSDRPSRKIVDLYAPPLTARTVPATTGPTAPEPVPATQPSAPAPEPVPVYRPRQFGNLITLDPGHGGEDYGVHPTQEDLEKNYTLQIAERIDARLRTTPYRGMLTRTHDTALAASQRSSMANYYLSRCYLSIHVGGAPAKDARGPVVYVYTYGDQDEAPDSNSRELRPKTLTPWEMGQKPFVAQSKQLGSLIQAELNAVYGTENRLVEAPLTQLAPVAAPAVLVEAGFLTNEEDQQKLATGEFQDRIAVAIVKAIQRFLD
ncbi:MAG: N-acetylmuramoyl-L-alanine amidase [Acidobacteriota bacterium]